MARRRERVGDLLREEISDLLLRQVNDPRLSGLITVTEVSVSPDMRYATVFVSVMGGEAEKKTVLEGLKAAAGFLRRELGHRLDMRRIPELAFQRDESIELGAHLMEIMKQVSQEKPQD